VTAWSPGPCLTRSRSRLGQSRQREKRYALTDPIPGAPALTQPDNWKPGALRLRTAIARFNSHTSPIKPHFAYGTLSRSDFAMAHAMHIANHQDEILVG
jgi:Protein of unknown function (DUF1569)